ncbi:isochorismatase family protein [Streptomyces sp. NPDC053728]|uniref:isochorismatase family protein n=1 Tax=unclassified Streptomyces TaxID=2593676 RepID=UPI0034254503
MLIEYQNDFTRKGAALNGAVAGVMEKTAMLANTVALTEAARAAGVTIMHATITFASPPRPRRNTRTRSRTTTPCSPRP